MKLKKVIEEIGRMIREFEIEVIILRDEYDKSDSNPAKQTSIAGRIKGLTYSINKLKKFKKNLLKEK